MYFTEVSILITQSSTPILAFTQTIFQYNFFYIYDKYDIVYILFLLKEKKNNCKYRKRRTEKSSEEFNPCLQI